MVAAIARWRFRRRLFRIALPVVALGALAFALYRWVLPPLKDWLPQTESPVLPALVLFLACLLVLLAVVWVLFPIFLLLEVRKMAETLARFEEKMNPASHEESSEEEEPVTVEEQPPSSSEGKSKSM
jgi:hypothetical protein